LDGKSGRVKAMFDGSILEWACGRGNLQMNLGKTLAETFNVGKRCRVVHRKGINAEKSNSLIIRRAE
jgi:hypothetical protein